MDPDLLVGLLMIPLFVAVIIMVAVGTEYNERKREKEERKTSRK